MIRKENAKIFYVLHITNTKVTHFMRSEFKSNGIGDTTYKKMYKVGKHKYMIYPT
jgi:hypothetical protein